MEVKVFVDGIPRVVCGVTEETTCQDVVIALAQALGQPGRYTLREKFKDFERCTMPSERLLETLERYGEQAKEVQLSLLHNGPSVWDEMKRTKVGRYHPCPPMRRKDAGARVRRSSGSLSLHRQSLPPLSCLRQEAEQQKDDVKRPKRKSLTLVEEAWEWLESLGKGKVYSTAGDKESSKKMGNRNRATLDVCLTVDKDSLDQSGKNKVRGEKSFQSDLDHQTSCCMGSQTRSKESKHHKKRQSEAKANDQLSSSHLTGEENVRGDIRETIIYQLSCLQDLQVQIACVDRQICELEEKQRAQRAEQKAQQRTAEEELEEIRLWESKLKAEEAYEKELERQFIEMRAKAVQCKAQLEEYKQTIQGLDFFDSQNIAEEDSKMTKPGTTEISTEGTNCLRSEPNGHNRKFLPRKDFSSSQCLVSPDQMKEQLHTGPTELRERWTRRSQAQSPQLQTKKKVIHRSELTIYLGSTKV